MALYVLKLSWYHSSPLIFQKASKNVPMSSEVKFLTVTENQDGQRLDNYLIARLKGVPRSLVYRVIRKGEVRVNKGRAKPDRKLITGDLVRIPPVRVSEKKPVLAGESLKKLLAESILYESAELLIVNKPSGLAVHGGSGVQLGLIEALRQMPEYGHFLELVHRLDRDTSGCVMVAKKRSMLCYLQDLLRQGGGIDKTYYALVKGRWSRRKTQVDAPLRKNELHSGERIVKVAFDGKPSKTEFAIERYFDNATLVRAKPITGRTHQIRVHALHAGHPLVGDEKYGDRELDKAMRGIGINRLFLHAFSLKIPMQDSRILSVSAPLPEDLEAGLAKLSRLDS